MWTKAAEAAVAEAATAWLCVYVVPEELDERA